MSRCLSMIHTAVMSIVCMCMIGACAVQGDEQDDAPAGDPATQDLTTPQVFTFFPPITTDAGGHIQLTGVLDIKDNVKVDMDIIQISPTVPNMTVTVQMGVFATVNAVVGSFALGTTSTIHSFNVTGPQVVVNIFGGPPNTAVNILGWVFVH